MRWMAILFVVFSAPGWVSAEGVDPVEDPESLGALPEPDSAMYRYLKARRLKCISEWSELAAPVEVTLGERAFTYTGPALTAVRPDSDGTVTLGVLGAVKDFSEDAQKALLKFLERFKKEKVDALVLVGDIASTEFEITQVLLTCAKTKLPVLAVIGNSEGRAAFNRAVLAALKVAPNVINFNIVRRVDLGGAVLVSLPGYQDKRFVHQTGGCLYRDRDLKALARIVKAAPAPVVLVSHGPPAGRGKSALDFAAEAGNVGDMALSGLIKKRGVPFGLFSHILEAGGQAVDDRDQFVKPGKWVGKLYINAGSANPLAWQLNTGKLSCGMAAVFRIKKDRANYTLLHHPCGRQR
jgi:Icc-related predicted phosphoesterase